MLMTCDEVGAYEFPSDFDAHAVEQGARELNAMLVRQGIETRFEDWIFNQDASFGLAIIIESAVKDTPHGRIEPTVRISNFGKMAAITFEDQMPSDVKQIVRNTLTETGYSCFSEDELDVPYDGVNVPNQAFPTWWVRYFDWL